MASGTYSTSRPEPRRSPERRDALGGRRTVPSGSGQDLGLLLLELDVADHAALLEIGQLGQLVGRSACSCGVLHVGRERLLLRLCPLQVASAHVMAMRDQVD